MGKGFSLIELMVVVVIMAILGGGSIVYVNRYRAWEKIRTTRDELEAGLGLARNYAKTLQKPLGAGGELEYVSVTLTADGILTGRMNGVGETYFSRDISSDGVEVTEIGSQDLWFSAYEGKLVGPTGPRDIIYEVVVTIGSREGVGETVVVRVNSFGLIETGDGGLGMQ